MKKIVSVILCAVLLCMLAVSVCADEIKSPSKDDGGKFIEIKVSGDSGSTDDLYDIVYHDGVATVTIKNDNGKYIKSVITGEYELISGSLNSTTFTVRLKGDATLSIIYENGTVNPKNEQSPKTGYTVYGICALAIVATFGAAYCFKRAERV